MPDLNALHERYGEQAAFYVVYIQEAHPVDAWQVQSNVKDNILIATHASEQERTHSAGQCVRDLGIRFPAVVDRLDNRVERAYTAWPDRLYVIDRDGRIAYKSAPGPFGFKPQQVGDALERLVGPTPQPETKRDIP